MQILEQTTVTVGKNNYLITALDATYGLNALNQLMSLEVSGVKTPPVGFVKELVLRSVKVNNMQPDEKWFNKYFSRNYKELYELFSEITKFNFDFGDDEESPNDESGTSETE